MLAGVQAALPTIASAYEASERSTSSRGVAGLGAPTPALSQASLRLSLICHLGSLLALGLRLYRRQA